MPKMKCACVDELGTLTEPGFYYMVANYEVAFEELVRLFRNADPELKDRMMATTAEAWMNQGRGRVQGQGGNASEADGAAFRSGSRGGAGTQVSAASVADLDGWLDAILDAGDIDEVFVNGFTH